MMCLLRFKRVTYRYMQFTDSVVGLFIFMHCHDFNKLAGCRLYEKKDFRFNFFFYRKLKIQLEKNKTERIFFGINSDISERGQLWQLFYLLLVNSTDEATTQQTLSFPRMHFDFLTQMWSASFYPKYCFAKKKN